MRFGATAYCFYFIELAKESGETNWRAEYGNRRRGFC